VTSPQDLPPPYVEQVHYVPVHVYHFPAHSPQLEEATKRNELLTLLAKSIEESANHKTNYATEKRIQQLLRELLRKETNGTRSR
jgi:hypothetical protein